MKYKIKNCDHCGKEFESKSSSHRFCTADCRIASTGFKKRIWEPLTCDVCGKIFIPKNANQKRCSKKCGDKYQEQSTNRDRYIIFARDAFTCVYCGYNSFHDRKELHVDHIIPVFCGGPDLAWNLVTSCKECNLGKASHRLPEFLEGRLLSEARTRNMNCSIDDNKPIKLQADSRRNRR